MDTEEPAAFGDRLRRYRRAAGLTQEALAERAGVSARAIADLERGVNQAPRRDTLQLLADALGLKELDRATLAGAARRPVRPDPPGAVPGQTPPIPAHGHAAGPGDGTSPGATLGVLTFLATEVVDSAALWEQQPAAMRVALARHDEIAGAVAAGHGGRLVRGRGEDESCLVVFASPSSALGAACALQKALLAEPWPATAVLRVRMALHTGEADPRDGYRGPVAQRAARLRALGHGGQILVSRSTRDLVGSGTRTGVDLRARGRYHLEGLGQPEEVFQVLHPGLPAEFPALRGRAVAPPGNLPAPLTSFVGREQEQATLHQLLGETRLLTLTGAGGSGKTRLALQVAAGEQAAYQDGVWLVELGPLGDPALVPPAVAQVLGVREEPGRPLLATLVEQLKERRMLLVLDTCEHLVHACAALAVALLQRCPQLRILATSREPLEGQGETVWQTPPLAFPDPEHPPAVGRLLEYGATRLFVERARARAPGFGLEDENAGAIVRLCARLDGLPLALELAAALTGVLQVEQIAARLDDRFRLLTGGPRTVLPHHQTLRATIDWSYALLDDREQALLRRLGVFQGGWALDAAEAVCTEEAGGGSTVLNLLAGLVRKSMVVSATQGVQARYGMLDTVREYARELLGSSGEAPGLERRHAAHYLAVAEADEPELIGSSQRDWLTRLDDEQGNLRAALGWAQVQGEYAIGLRMAGSLCRYWLVRGELSEGRRWIETALARAAADGTQVSPRIRAKALTAAGLLSQVQADYGHAADRLDRGLALWRELGDQRGCADALNGLGTIAYLRGDTPEAIVLYTESLGLRRALGDRRGVANALNNLASVSDHRGDHAEAVALFEESLALFRAQGDAEGTALALTNLGAALAYLGEHARALPMHQESLELYRAVGKRRGAAFALHHIGAAATQLGEHGRARACFRESLRIAREIGDREIACWDLEGLAALDAAAAQEGNGPGAHTVWPEAAGGIAMAEATATDDFALRAARLLGAAETMRGAIGAPLPPPDVEKQGEITRRLRVLLGEADFLAAWSEGRRMSDDEAIAAGLDDGGPA